MFDNIVRVRDKIGNLIAIFSGDTEGISEDAMADLLIAPTVRIESNGTSTLTFQMLASSPKWQDIKSPENIFELNGRFYTLLSENSITYTDNNGVSVAEAVLVERWALLSRQYHQVYNCGVYCYAVARFNRFVNDGAEFTIAASRCSAIGDVISTANAWEQVKNWSPKDANGNQISYAIASSDERKPTNWENYPSGVFFKSFSVSGSNATVVIESRAKQNVSKVFQYASNGQYNLGETPIPSTVSGVKVNSTIITKTGSGQTYNTSDKTTSNYTYNSSSGILTLRYSPAANEMINAITVTYTKSDLGKISSGATCTFAYGAEAIDEHTFVVLPKANKKYKLTIDGVPYDDTQVKDSRGIIMPRGSGGYAMWAALKGTGWTLGICDVIALDFDASIDYGCFNVESDMKDTLSNIRYIQQLYGGILDWDSENKILNYRAENYDHYQAYKDGFNEWKGYVFREGKNMTARPVITYDNNIITRAYLLGYGNLNVRKVNGGKTYVENFDYTKDVYEGYLKQELIYDTRDEGGMKQLLYWGKKELEKQSRPRKNVKLEVTDVRTVEGLEHEVFDINDIVKVYYHDESTDFDVIEEQRVVLWEYNAFAMWECTVELGDKTVNEVELFKLIYNKSLNTPGTDGSGNISSGNITVGGGSDGDIWNQNSLTNHIELIARTTTDNSDAIAALILDTDAYHAQVDLFAYYQKQTDTLLTEAYAGLQAYASEQGAYALLQAQHYTDDKEKGIRTWAEAGFYAEATERQALARQFADFQKEQENEWSKAHAELQTLADADKSMSTLFTNYQKTVANEFSATKTSIREYADARVASVEIVAAKATDYWGEQNGIRLRIQHNGIYVDNVSYPPLAFKDVTIPITDYIPQVIIDSSNVVYNLNTQINGNNGLYQRLNAVASIMDGWTYGDSTFIDGSKIMTGTVYATQLKGGSISLLDSNGYDTGVFYIRPSSSYGGRTVELAAGAVGLVATDGSVWISAAKGAELHASQYISFSAPSVQTTTAITNVSDKSLKKDISYDLSAYTKMFDSLKPCSYKMIDGTSDRKHIGMIADDVERILEESHIGTQDFAGYVKDEDGIRGLRYSEFIGLCIAKIQDQDREIRKIKSMMKM